MRTRSAIAAAAAGIAAGAVVGASRRAEREAARQFYDWPTAPGDLTEVDGIVSRPPLYVHSMELFGSLYPADRGQVANVLPSDDVRPVRLPDGRAIVFVGGIHYRDMTMAGFEGGWLPYGEVIVAPLVSRAALPPVVPLAALGGLPLPSSWRAGMFYLFVPVTHRWTRDAGWTLGFPKFVADLEFEETPGLREVRAAQGGEGILRLRVPVSGAVRVSRAPLVGYTSFGGKLWEFEPRVFAYQQMSPGGRGVELELGTHEVADRIRELGLAERALGSFSWVAGRAIIPLGREVGRARPFDGFRGDDRWFGTYTIRRPGTAPADQYAYLTRGGIEQAIIRGGGRPIAAYETIDEELGRSPAPAKATTLAKKQREAVPTG